MLLMLNGGNNKGVADVQNIMEMDWYKMGLE